MVADHPRIRGEHGRVGSPPRLPQGSSPHTRGARRRQAVPGLLRGIIPAYAGSTPRPPACTPTCPDHPRIRGEHSHTAVKGRCVGGSSPHTRGAPARPFNRLGGCGIIPAYAGSTRLMRRVVSAPRDHPRIRGEHRQDKESAMDRSGSSPHTRGAQRVATGLSTITGIIPAYAGSTMAATRPSTPLAGSSPHTRGAQADQRRDRERARIIPAYAGSTPAGPARGSRSPDHPRIRGEHGKARELRFHTPGSSPHTRGARPPARPPPGAGRIIPAYAGSTPLAVPEDVHVRDHPRIRGEHVKLSYL